MINGWLVQMGVGEMPTDTLLLDPEMGLEQDSAEAIYDRIAGDLRLIRRLNKARTLRGQLGYRGEGLFTDRRVDGGGVFFFE